MHRKSFEWSKSQQRTLLECCQVWKVQRWGAQRDRRTQQSENRAGMTAASIFFLFALERKGDEKD